MCCAWGCNEDFGINAVRTSTYIVHTSYIHRRQLTVQEPTVLGVAGDDTVVEATCV